LELSFCYRMDGTTLVQSGSGKSTMMNILGCLDRPTSGTYELGGKLVSRMGAAALARVRNERIGFVFQSFELMPRLSALKNVELPLVYAKTGWLQRRRRAKAALERVGLGDRMSHRPNQLSGGQKQRVAIARALISEPSILLADEPTGNLDSKTTSEIIELIARLHSEGQTIIMVTHEEDVAQYAKRIVRMRDGCIQSDLEADHDETNRAAVLLHRSMSRTKDPEGLERDSSVQVAAHRSASRSAPPASVEARS